MLEKIVIQQTKNWLKSFIIKYNICPFAKNVYDKEVIYYAVDESVKIELCLTTLMLEIQRLEQQSSIETTLIIYPCCFNHFDDYLDFLFLAESLLVEQGYESIYQLASFHPLYCFEGEDAVDAANYTNRSPYPMLHLIREASLEQALKYYPNPELIPPRNIDLTRKMGSHMLQSILEQIKI